jgi:putative ATP-dependent endonuclease of OLD family
VQRDDNGIIHGTTVFRPSKIKLDADQKGELKLLNVYDPYVAEFFFGGRTILVEGDTEYTAFKFIIANDPDREIFQDVHIVRARGKVTIGLLAKILNQFGARYAVLHDSDTPTITTRRGIIVNPAWTNNKKILENIASAPNPEILRLVASLINFESAMFACQVDKEKPYNAYNTLKSNKEAYGRVRQLLCALLDFTKPLPQGCVQWSDINVLQQKVAEALLRTQS